VAGNASVSETTRFIGTWLSSTVDVDALLPRILEDGELKLSGSFRVLLAQANAVPNGFAVLLVSASALIMSGNGKE
jgi:hypothetical protein